LESEDGHEHEGCEENEGDENEDEEVDEDDDVIEDNDQSLTDEESSFSERPKRRHGGGKQLARNKRAGNKSGHYENSPDSLLMQLNSHQHQRYGSLVFMNGYLKLNSVLKTNDTILKYKNRIKS
jgi:hypothetical protein